MNYRITNGSVSYGAETILEEINFNVKGKEKVAIVGRNGSGKSTLLKALINNELLSEGVGIDKFSVYKESVKEIGYLKQIDFEDDSITMLDEILKVYQEIIDLEKKIENLVIKMQSDSSEELGKEYSKLHDRYELLDGYTYKKEYETAINKFGFSNEDKNKKISEFSGGQRTKIAFIKLLLSKPDLLLLDEPTNHLDITTIEWLEGYLKNYPKAVVIVSHDRMFLNKIVDKIYEIEYGAITEYSGDYEFFEKQKRVNYERQLKDFEFQQKEIKRLNDIADRFRYKPTKAKMALSKLKQIERMTIIEEPNKYDLRTFHTDFNIPVESGKLVVSAKKLKIGYNNNPFAEISFELYKGQKLGIIGENGIGKSTLLKTLMGDIPNLGGELEYGYHVKKEYFDQQMDSLNPNNTIFDEFSNEFPSLTTTKVRSMLGTFQFTGEDVFKEIKVLSGGEKVRLQLCKIFKKEANLLLLDEPTNHMDIVGKESLENILKEYKGSLIFVSHDRYFVNKIADSILAFEKEGVSYFNGNYEEYCRYKESKMQEEVIEEKKENDRPKNTNNTYLQNKENARKNRKIDKLEREIEQKENEIKEIEKEMQREEVCSDYVKLKELQDQIKGLEIEVEMKMQEWEELNNT